MSWRFTGKTTEFILYAICILTGISMGALILSGLSLKWVAAAASVMCFVLFLLIARNEERALLFTIAFIVPFHIGTGLPAIIEKMGHIGSARSLDIQLIDILVAILLLTQLARDPVHRTYFQSYPAITIPALTWIAFSALSALSARDVDLVAIQVGQMIKLFMFYIVIANSIRDEDDIKWLVWALISGAAFQGLLGIYQVAAGSSLGLSFLGEASELFHGRAQGTIGHPNGYGAYLSGVMPLALALLFVKVPARHKILATASLCVSGLGLLLCLSRGGWVSFIAAFAMVLTFVFKRHRPTLKTLVGVSLTLVVFFLLLFSQRDRITDRLTSSQAVDSALSRISLAKGAFAMLSDYPVTGVGLNNYSLFMPKYDAFDFARENQIVIVHNVYLLVAAETGIIGVACFLWLFATLFFKTLQIIRKSQNDVIWLVGVGAFSAFTALAVHSLADYDMIANVTIFRLFWLFAAVVAGLSPSLQTARNAQPSIKVRGEA